MASLIENGGASLSPPGSGNDPYPAHIRHVIEARMEVGDGLVLFTRDNLFEYKNAGSSNNIIWFDFEKGTCMTGEKSHQCTFLTGRLLKRYEDQFG